jgi:iron transport multicopper oxidase
MCRLLFGDELAIHFLEFRAFDAVKSFFKMSATSIIEADGISHEPVTAEGFEIFVGQRYSAVLEPNQPVGNYWISAPMTLQH